MMTSKEIQAQAKERLCEIKADRKSCQERIASLSTERKKHEEGMAALRDGPSYGRQDYLRQYWSQIKIFDAEITELRQQIKELDEEERRLLTKLGKSY